MGTCRPRSQDRFRSPRVNAMSFPDPKRLPSTSARMRFYANASPPPVSRFCHLRSGFRRSFAAPRSREGTARPASRTRGLFNLGLQRATRRSSTSATKVDLRARLRDARTPHTTSWSPTDAALSFRLRVARRLSTLCQPRPHRSGVECARNRSSHALTSSRHDRS